MKKHILIINTGGTISSIKSEKGYEPLSDYVEDALKQIPALKHPEMPHYTIKEYRPLVDSSNITVQNWNHIAKDISDNYEKYDGFVVFHGTDTMAYTASILSFMLENLSKPVIVTGSQIPLSEVRNDAIDNVITSLWLSANQVIPEVCIYFNQRLLRGNRCQKVHTQSFDAFDSPNYPDLANIGIDIELNKNYVIKRPKGNFHMQEITPSFIANFRLFPGFSSQVLANILDQPLKGLILETYGAGNAQNNDPKFLEILKNACDKGIIIVNCTQCYKGKVMMEQYATGKSLKKLGIISGHDMTTEAAHCKLLFLLSKYQGITAVKKLMVKNLQGELTR